MITRYSMLITDDELKVLYRVYDNKEKEMLANIILEYRNNRIYTSRRKSKINTIKLIMERLRMKSVVYAQTLGSKNKNVK